MKNRTIPVLLAAFPLFGIWRPTSAAEAYWPGWLGPKHNGWVADFKPPEQWPDKLKKTWQVKVGTGYGSPIVAGGKVYQHARQGEDEVVHCLDLKTGKALWSKSHSTPFKIGGGGERHGKGPKSSPVYADGRLFTMSIAGAMTAWDTASGKVLWRKGYGSRFGKAHAYWGTSNSPIVDGDRVINHFGNDKYGALVALDVETGEEVWTQGKDGTCYSSPLLIESHGIRQVMEWNHRAIVGVESKTGQLLWEYPFPHKTHNQHMPTPAFHNGQILIGGENRGFHGIEPKLEDGKWTVTKRWSQKEVALDMSSAVVNDGLLYGFSHYGLGRIFCLNPKTGEILWQGPHRTGENVMFLSVPGYVLALINRGEIQVIKATGKSFEKVASWRVAQGSTWAPPVLLQHGILVKDLENLTFWAL